MKQKDIATIIIVAGVAAIMSFLIASKIFVTPKSRQQTVEIIDVLSDSFNVPNDKKYFNDTSINPTSNTSLSDTNQTPFNGAAQ